MDDQLSMGTRPLGLPDQIAMLVMRPCLANVLSCSPASAAGLCIERCSRQGVRVKTRGPFLGTRRVHEAQDAR